MHLSGQTPMSKHIVIFSGSGVSAESGISTFRDPDGMWAKYDAACDIAAGADILLVVGTSLAVYSAASLVDHVSSQCEVYAVDSNLSNASPRRHYLKETAASGVPKLVEQWINS